MTPRESIVALSSGRLPAGVAVVRMSGGHTRFVVERIAGSVPQPRQAALKTLRDPNGMVLDRGVVIFFEGPASFTGEDVAEFQVHGSRAVVNALLAEIVSFPGVRLAEPGEFTRRAMVNGKIDLIQAEALADLVQAETEAQRRFALRSSDGEQSELYDRWRKRMLAARALLEAELDFSDEGDVPGEVSERVWQDLSSLSSALSDHVEGFRRAEILRDGYDVAIIGAPNAGKSSLLNALVRREAAIVTDEPGTTRDLIEVALDINGIKVRLTDTAGIREGAGAVEALGIQRAKERARDADLVLQVEDMVAPAGVGGDIGELARVVRVGSKADLRKDAGGTEGFDFVISAKTGEGISLLVDGIGARAEAAVGSAVDFLPSRSRHVDLLKRSISHLDNAVRSRHLPLELRAEELRIASDDLGRITGAIDVEDILDTIFSEFCIAK